MVELLEAEAQQPKKEAHNNKKKNSGSCWPGNVSPSFQPIFDGYFCVQEGMAYLSFFFFFFFFFASSFLSGHCHVWLVLVPSEEKEEKKYFPRAVLLALSIGRHAPGLSFCVRVCVLLSIDVEATTREKHTRKYLSLSLSLVLCLSAGPLIQSGRGRWLLLISVKAMATQHTAQRIPLQSPFFCDD